MRGGPPASDAGTVQFGGLLLPSCGEGDTLVAFVGWVGSSPAGLQKPALSDASSLAFQIRTLQEQLENGPNTQLARLQQENSILRDALNQATSQVESK